MGIFGKKSEVAPEAPAKRPPTRLMGSELADAIRAACEGMDKESSANQILEKLYYSVDRHDKPVDFDGGAAVTLSEFDSALAESSALSGLPAGTRKILERVRVLIANSEAKIAKAGAEFVTRGV